MKLCFRSMTESCSPQPVAPMAVQEPCLCGWSFDQIKSLGSKVEVMVFSFYLLSSPLIPFCPLIAREVYKLECNLAS